MCYYICLNGCKLAMFDANCYICENWWDVLEIMQITLNQGLIRCLWFPISEPIEKLWSRSHQFCIGCIAHLHDSYSIGEAMLETGREESFEYGSLTSTILKPWWCKCEFATTENIYTDHWPTLCANKTNQPFQKAFVISGQSKLHLEIPGYVLVNLPKLSSPLQQQCLQAAKDEQNIRASFN